MHRFAILIIAMMGLCAGCASAGKEKVQADLYLPPVKYSDPK